MEGFNIGNLVVNKPIIQGGMGVGISLSGLASAVANEGGIGVISAAAIGLTEKRSSKDYKNANKLALKKHLRLAREKSKGIIGVNLMVALTDYNELLETVIEEKADVVFMGAGLPLKFPQFVIDRGFNNIHTKFIPKVSGVKAIKVIFNYWAKKFNYVPDALVIEGPKAGGHLGYKREELENDNIELSDLVKEAIKVLSIYEEKFDKKIPIIAAGGIYSGEDAYEIMKNGAKAVKMGTRFVTTHECDAAIEFKESYINSNKDDITLIDSPVGLPGRVIKNDFVNKIINGETKPFSCPWKCLKTCDYKKVSYCISKVLYLSSLGRMKQGFAFAGSNAYKAKEIVSVKDVFNSLQEEYYNAKSKQIHAT